MRSFIAAFLISLHVAPTVAIGVCASGLADGAEAINCPMANPQVAAREQASAQAAPADMALWQAEHAAHCCDIGDLCMFSSPAIQPAPSTVAVQAVASTAPVFSYTSSPTREATAPPSPPPNA